MKVIPLYAICQNDPELSTLLADDVGLKVSEFHNNLHKNPPFISWQIISAIPEQALDYTTDDDEILVQIDVYAKQAQQVRALAQSLRNVLRDHCAITAYTGAEQDFETQLWRCRLESSWFI